MQNNPPLSPFTVSQYWYCCLLYTVGDLIQQRIEGSKQVNWKRTARMATLGLFMGPLNHTWYYILDSRIIGQGVKVVGKKVLADQLIMAPVCCTTFYIGMCLLEGRGKEAIKEEVETKFWPTYKTDWKIWPMAQVINFFFLPSHLRVTYVNVVTLVWTVYLSHMKHKNMMLNVQQTDKNSKHCELKSENSSPWVR